MRIRVLLVGAMLLGSCGPSAAQILAMGDWSAAARAACATPGACPRERACILGVIAATQPSAVSASSYKTAAKACQPYGAPAP